MGASSDIASDFLELRDDIKHDLLALNFPSVGNGVAQPIGQGLTVEEQLSGHALNGGPQVQVYPMRREGFLRRHPGCAPVGGPGAGRVFLESPPRAMTFIMGKASTRRGARASTSLRPS